MGLKRSILNIGFLAGIAVMPSAASDLVVIAHAELQVSEVSAEDLRAVFLGTKTSLHGSGEVQPVLTTSRTELTEFAAEYLGKTAPALRTYYRSLVFTGKWSMPMSLDSDAEVIAYVARTRGAIGFVHASILGPPALRPAVKTVRVK